MRTTFGEATVRLYRLSAALDLTGDGAAQTLFYGPLDQALARAAAEAEPEDLYLATDNDVVAYLDLIGDRDDE